jgi:dihydroorotate dehydrogenase
MGAGAVQLYSALVHHGPGLVRAILSELADRLRAEGFTTIAQAVGTLR